MALVAGFGAFRPLRRPAPLLEGLHRRGQGREQQSRLDLVGQAEGLQAGQQVLLDAGQGEYGALAGDRGRPAIVAEAITCGTR
jgi:hypothetical protein